MTITLPKHLKWTPYLEEVYLPVLQQFVEQEYTLKTIYPKRHEVFRAFELTDYDQVRVVILGQDPYHGLNQANGLAFSVREGMQLPPSLRHIFQELAQDLNVPMRQNGDLTDWARQGVLLLNTVLTVEEGKAHSHKGKGWEVFTDKVLQVLNDTDRSLIFVLWGNAARKKVRLIDQQRHKVIEAAHPSPLSAYRGFFGSKPFSQINDQLLAWGEEPIHF